MTSQHTDVRYLTEVMCLYVGAMGGGGDKLE